MRSFFIISKFKSFLELASTINPLKFKSFGNLLIFFIHIPRFFVRVESGIQITYKTYLSFYLDSKSKSKNANRQSLFGKEETKSDHF